MAINDLVGPIIPAVAACIPILSLFVVRGLDRGKTQAATDTQVTNVMAQIPEIRKHIGEIFERLSETESHMAVIEERLKNHINGSKNEQ